MKKRLFGILLSLAMVITMMPAMATMTAFAATTYTANSTDSLKTAIGKASPGDTIKLTGNTTTGNIWIEKNITLDLNGYSMSGSADNGTVCVEYATVTIKNSSSTRSTISGTGGNGSMLIYASGAVHLEGAITFSNKVCANSGCTLYVDDPNIKFSSETPSSSRMKWYQYSVSSWAELKHAADLAPKNGTAATITLTADIPAANEFLGIVKGQNITLDMNGHNITSTQGNSAIYSQVDCTVIIKNSSTTRSTIKGTVNTSSNSGMGAIWSINGGKYYIQGNVTLNGVYGSTFYIDGPNVKIDNFFGTSTKSTYYKVSYNSNGGTTAPAAQYKKHTANLTLSSTAPTRNGYTLKGWNTAANGTGTNYGFTYNTNVATTLYAQWSQNQNLTYNANGHGTAPNTVTMTYNAATKAAEAIPATGYTFNGWNTKADGTGTAYAAGAVVKAVNVDPAATTLYAQWTANNYNVTMKNGEGSGLADGSVKATYDAELPGVAVPKWNKHVFEGYYTQADGKGTQYIDQDGKGVKAWDKDSDTTLYAYWLDSAKIEAMDLLLKEDIGMRFHTSVNDTNLESGHMKMSIGSKNSRTETVYFDATPEDANSKKLFKFDVNAIQLAEPVTATYYDESDNEYAKVTQSVQKYYNDIPDTEEYKKSKAMVKALLNYGHYAQLALSPIRNWTIGTDYKAIAEQAALTQAIDDTYKAAHKPVVTKGEGPITLSALNLSLLLDSKTTLCMYFTTTDGKEPTVTVEDENKAAVTIEGPQKMSDGRWLVKIPNIAAQDLGKKFTVTAGGYTIELSALSYGATISGDANINAAIALYEYYLAVQEFIKPMQ